MVACDSAADFLLCNLFLIFIKNIQAVLFDQGQGKLGNRDSGLGVREKKC